MATGWTRDGAVQEQIDSTVQDAVDRARLRLGAGGNSRLHCQQCGATIPARRRELIPGVRRCVACQAEHDDSEGKTSLYNRRASKDSQLR